MYHLHDCTVTDSNGVRCVNQTTHTYENQSATICPSHQYRIDEYGDALADIPLRPYRLNGPRAMRRYEGATEEEKFWNRVDRTSEPGHWLWLGGATRAGTPGATPQTRWKGKPGQGAAKVAWMLTGRVIPSGFKVVRQCERVMCVRPECHTVKPGASTAPLLIAAAA